MSKRKAASHGSILLPNSRYTGFSNRSLNFFVDLLKFFADFCAALCRRRRFFAGAIGP